ncbi:putative 3-hydroxybutyryl-CoA dehydrogenase [Pirellula sp. SH-Sr6A]|uniref:3-hydroxyacyl-CoA dehydrogenase NAD-binding domain-containing protein n=1 Tax=Pirellula sp. SH-Sr6A TaxID=1632865 RepID=UPI00078B22F0|nr:3-hydroxyacyl-CoA dehydrogenase NAD-binding domain-containing protein [Pirellula sp. SH-Sr6A]AMV32524.1 putative 3-hydroxybutyryl-CoA dehydrogenase [Pirellula sp. SH-Sr6A]
MADDPRACSSPPAPEASGIARILVVGAGWVGRQIVGQFAANGFVVEWLDASETALRSGEEWLRSKANEAEMAAYWPADRLSTIRDRVLFLTKISDASDAVDLVLESVTEQVSVKRKVLQAASARFPERVLIASNSSYFTPSMLDRFVTHPERFAHMHFHVPVWRTRLVDVACSPRTSSATAKSLSRLAAEIGQKALVETVENPGYVFNWLLRSLLQSALQLKAKGVAEPESIDFAWRQVTGMELGPFGIMDQIGLDLIHQTMSAARFVDGDAQWQPLIDQLQPLVDAGKLGLKTGEGFFKYPSTEGNDKNV